MLGNFRHRHKSDGRVRAEHDGHRRRFILCLILPQVQRGVLFSADQKACLVPAFHLHSISPDVAHARLRILGDDERGREKGRGVFSHGPHRHRQLQNIHLIAGENVLLARAGRHHARRNRFLQSLNPLPGNPFARIGLQAERVDFARRAQDSRDQGDLKSLDVFKHHGRAAVGGNFEEELPADRGDLPIFIHLFANSLEFSFSLQRCNVISQVTISHFSSCQAAEKGPSTALCSARFASTYWQSTPPLADHRTPCIWDLFDRPENEIV